jgi:peroxiredoxin
MNAAALAARLLLALVFAVAGAAKLADRKGSRRTLVAFGFPTALAVPLGILLPLFELAVAGALLPTSTAFWGALGALALLTLFTVGIGLNLARGRKPDCRCFGQLHSVPAGWKTLARNGGLAAIAGFLVWQWWGGDVGAVGWTGNTWVIGMPVLVGVALLSGFLVHWRNGRFAGGADVSTLSAGRGGTCGKAGGDGVRQGAPTVRRVGEPAPEIEVRGPSGDAVNLWSIEGGETLVVFYNPDCVFCQRMLPDLRLWERRPSEGALEMLVISAGPERLELDSPVLFDRKRSVFREFGVGETPSATLIDAEGRVASDVAFGAPAVFELAGGFGRKGA